MRAGHRRLVPTQVGNHTFRATGITAYLKNGGTLENAAAMANHASTRTTQLYDRRRDEMSASRSALTSSAMTRAPICAASWVADRPTGPWPTTATALALVC